jgi:hypothetical protein
VPRCRARALEEARDADVHYCVRSTRPVPTS